MTDQIIALLLFSGPQLPEDLWRQVVAQDPGHVSTHKDYGRALDDLIAREVVGKDETGSYCIARYGSEEVARVMADCLRRWAAEAQQWAVAFQAMQQQFAAGG